MKRCKDGHNFGISNFLEQISNLSHSDVFLYFFALITEEGFIISPSYSLELCIQMGISFLFSFAFASLLFIAICKASSDNHFVFLHLFFLGMVLITASCTKSWTSIHSSSTLEFISHFHCIIVSDWFRSYQIGLLLFPTFFNWSLNLSIRNSGSVPQSAPGLLFADCIELLHLWLQRI